MSSHIVCLSVLLQEVYLDRIDSKMSVSSNLDHKIHFTSFSASLV